MTPASIQQDAPSPDHKLVCASVGNLESFLRAAARQSKWALVLLLPSRFSAPCSSTTVSPRPAWGPGAYHQPKKLYALGHIADKIMVWKRTKGSADAERYQAFFPVDGHPHLALLDPRSGERLAVWGNADNEGMESYNSISNDLWTLVLDELEVFLDSHSLEDNALGPVHFQEKSWAVRTRRVAEPASVSCPNLPSTSVMDDEEAAIAAAIAASLAEADSNEQRSSDDEYSEDSDSSGSSDEILSNDSMPREGNTSADQTSSGVDEISAPSEDSNDTGLASMEISPRLAEPRRPISMPVPIPFQTTDPNPSSLESLSYSYIERMESRFRSNTSPELLKVRRLRQEQDEELARSLQEDRKRMHEEELAAAQHAAEKTQQLAAAARLPNEPREGSEGALTIALRVPGGGRIARRFAGGDKLMSVVDFATAEVGCVDLLTKAPNRVLRIAGGQVKAMSWETKLEELGLSRRTMFILNTE